MRVAVLIHGITVGIHAAFQVQRGAEAGAIAVTIREELFVPRDVLMPR